MKRILRAVSTGAIAAALTVTAAVPATAQIPALPDLPVAPDGAIGALLAPLEDLIEEITGPLGDALGDVPLDNAVTLTGSDAVEAAVALSAITFDTSQFVYIGRDDVFADTLSSVAGQGIAGAPLLLTQTDQVDPRTAAEMDRLGVTNVIILGSHQAISADVEQTLADTYGTGNVTRVGGPSRIETAADLAATIAPAADRVVLMRAYPSAGNDQSQAYADALSAGPLASGMELPSLLTTTDYLHPATEAYIDDAGVTAVSIIGGPAAVGTEVEDALLNKGITVTRIAGENRWHTSVLVANALGIMDAADSNRLILTEGGSIEEPLWAAGFAAAAHGAVYESPVILADGPLLPPETIAFIADGLVSNALRLSNQPVICNSFVDFLACETAALLQLGALDEVNALTDGQLEAVLGPVLDELAALLDGIIPGAGDMGPGLVGQILSLIGVDGTEEDTAADQCSDGVDNDSDGEIDEADECTDNPEARFMTAMAGQPTGVNAAFVRMTGPEDDRVSPTRQQVLADILTDVNATLDGPVDTTDPVQADALVALLDGISTVLGDRSGNVPLDELADVLVGLEALTDGLVDAAAAASIVEDLGIDAGEVVEELTDEVAGLLTSDTGFMSTRSRGDDLADRYGERARPLADAIDRIAG